MASSIQITKTSVGQIYHDPSNKKQKKNWVVAVIISSGDLCWKQSVAVLNSSNQYLQTCTDKTRTIWLDEYLLQVSEKMRTVPLSDEIPSHHVFMWSFKVSRWSVVLGHCWAAVTFLWWEGLGLGVNTLLFVQAGAAVCLRQTQHVSASKPRETHSQLNDTDQFRYKNSNQQLFHLRLSNSSRWFSNVIKPLLLFCLRTKKGKFSTSAV